MSYNRLGMFSHFHCDARVCRGGFCLLRCWACSCAPDGEAPSIYLNSPQKQRDPFTPFIASIHWRSCSSWPLSFVRGTSLKSYKDQLRGATFGAASDDISFLHLFLTANPRCDSSPLQPRTPVFSDLPALQIILTKVTPPITTTWKNTRAGRPRPATLYSKATNSKRRDSMALLPRISRSPWDQDATHPATVCNHSPQ